MVYHCSVQVLLKAALLHRLSGWVGSCVAGMERALLDWLHPGGAFSNATTEKTKPHKPEEIKPHFCPLKRAVIYSVHNHAPCPKTQPLTPKSVALQVTTLSARLHQVCLDDLCSCFACGPTWSTQHPVLTLRLSPLRFCVGFSEGECQLRQSSEAHTMFLKI